MQMNDPYQVLGIPRDADDAQVKKAYRSLARKYHPDNYHESALEDLAQERMKAINAAYEQICTQRRSGKAPGPAPRRAPPPPPQPQDTLGLFRVRQAIFVGQLDVAEGLLDACPRRDGEWYFLRGTVALRRGWMDEAIQNYQTACRMDPDNREYRRALEYMEQGPSRAYAPDGAFTAAALRCGARLARCALCAGGIYCCWGYDAALKAYTGDALGTLLCSRLCPF